MALCHKKLWELLIDKDMTRTSLREATGIAPAAISKFNNILVRDDNLEALKALPPFCAGEVKRIYIDPPYSTGSAFGQAASELAEGLRKKGFEETEAAVVIR